LEALDASLEALDASSVALGVRSVLVAEVSYFHTADSV
jgi:hypothetical protein